MSVMKPTVGMVADSVSDVITLKPDDVKPAPEFHGVAATEHGIGIGTAESNNEHRALILLDIQKWKTNKEVGLITISSVRN